MEGPKNTNLFPILSQARVVGYDTQHHAVYVSLPSMQSISTPVKILFHGTSDASRIEQQPLPIVGTWGLVAFPYGLVEGAIWLGSFYQTGVTAVNASNHATNEDGQMKYMSHASGSWYLLDYLGQYAMTFGDNTQILINSDNNTPTTHRQVIDPEKGYSAIEYFQSDRNPNPSPPFWISLNHPGSGASATISPSGDVLILGGGPLGTTQAAFNLINDGTAIMRGGNGVQASWTIQPNGITTLQTGTNPGAVGSGIQTGPTAQFDPQQGLITITGANGKASAVINKDGDVLITAADGNSNIHMDKDGAVIATAANGHSQINMDKNGNITIKTDNGQINIESDAGNIFLNTQTHTDSVDTIINTFNSHVHSGVQSGSNNSGPPTSVLP
jgi:hypothetical protein